jgi:hypothetical protein
LGTPASRGDVVGATLVVGGATVVVVEAAELDGGAFGGGGVVDVVVVVTGDEVVALGEVRPVHGVFDGVAALSEGATTVDGTVTVVVGADGLPPVTGLRRASGCSAIAVPGASTSSVSNGVVWLALVGCGRPNAGPALGSS